MKKLLILFILLAGIVYADPIPQYNKIFLEPFYRDSMTANTNYNYNLVINPSDEVGQTVTAMITFQVYYSPTVTYTLTVDGQQCKNPSFTISTTYASASMGYISFDCSNVITKSGNYAMILRGTKNNGAIYGWVDYTYINTPPAKMTFHGTEYDNTQTAKLWLQLINSTGDSVNNGVCFLDVYTPSNAYYIEYAQMINMVHDGIYYYDLPAPLNAGVYPAIARCFYTAVSDKYFPSAYFIERGTYDGGTISSLLTIDGDKLKIKENAPSPRRLSAGLNITNIGSCATVNPLLLNSITVSLYGKFDSEPNDDLTIWIYNYTSSKWKQLSNKLLEGNVFSYSVNSIITSNITKSGLYRAGKGIRLKFNDTTLTDGADSKFEIDEAFVSCNRLSGLSWQEVRGSSEMHISSPAGTDPFYVRTLCGAELFTSSYSSGCAQFKNDDSYWNYTWGYIFDNITIINSYGIELTDKFFDYETQLGQDCTAMIDIIKHYENGTVEDIFNQTSLSAGNKENCLLQIPISFSATEYSYYIEITQDNYMRWEVQRDKDLVNYFKLIIQPFCQEVAAANNKQYNIPIEVGGEQNISSLYANQPIFLGCYRSMDDIYWFDSYYNDSLDISVAGIYESYLLEARYYYPEIRAEASIVQSITVDPVSLLFNVQTLCGTDAPTCAIAYPPDDYFSSQEGYIIENLTVTNTFNTQLEGSYRYTAIPDVDCTAILEILLYHEDGNITDIYDNVTFSLGNTKNCIMDIPISFDDGETRSNVIIKMENYIHWNMFQMEDKVKSIRNNTEEICNAVFIAANKTYELPINGSIDYLLPDLNTVFCYRALDDLYWWDYFYDIHIIDTVNHTIAVPIGTMQGSYAEFLYFYPFIIQNDQIVSAYLASPNQKVTLGLLYNILTNTSKNVWSYSNRTLTDIEFPNTTLTDISENVWKYENRTLTNASNIAGDMWGANVTIHPGLLVQFADTVWNYVARYIHGEII